MFCKSPMVRARRCAMETEPFTRFEVAPFRQVSRSTIAWMRRAMPGSWPEIIRSFRATTSPTEISARARSDLRVVTAQIRRPPSYSPSRSISTPAASAAAFMMLRIWAFWKTV